MHDQAGGLVDDDEVLVLEDDVERQVLAGEIGVLGGRRDDDDFRARGQFGRGIARLERRRPRPPASISALSRVRDSASRRSSRRAGEESVEPLARLGRADLEVDRACGDGEDGPRRWRRFVERRRAGRSRGSPGAALRLGVHSKPLRRDACERGGEALT